MKQYELSPCLFMYFTSQQSIDSYHADLKENAPIGTTAIRVNATDADEGSNGDVVYSFGNDVDARVRALTKSRLDREQQSQYVVTIVAKDAGEPSLSSDKTIQIVVSDVNDNSPEFSQNPYTFYITETNSPGSSILSVTARDDDEGSNAHITYHIFRDRGGENLLSSFLNINSENGDIVALKSFDFETLKTFHFHVVASDSGTPSLSSNVTVNVFILDQNDNAPVILYPVSQIVRKVKADLHDILKVTWGYIVSEDVNTKLD
uniref:Cadherin domain-containing protein n=1 Tax=Scophthalmus maximus TaxID=52904 RepID=A0A8D3CK85_SCOMX